MKIKDFLEKLDGSIHIKIFDRHDFETHRFNSKKAAIDKFGYFTVQSWCIENNALRITIQSQSA